MTDKEKLIKIKSLADKMYNAAFNLTTDTSLLRKAMNGYHQFIIHEYHKEEPVSEGLSTELDAYIKDNFTIEKDFLEKYGLEEKDYMYSMDKSDMLKMIRHFTNNYKVPTSDVLEEATKLCVSDYFCITNEEDWDEHAIDALNIFKIAAQWQKKQDQSTIELAEDHAMLAGMEKMKEEMMAKAIDGYVIEDIEEGNGDFLLSAEYLPKSMGLKDRQKVKVIAIKEED